MKFKGTQGKWEHFKSESYCEIQIQKPLISICAVNPNIEEHLYNAQLISKAPELLGQLKVMYDFYETIAMKINSDDFDEEFRSKWNPIMSKTEQLIEEATKID